MRHPASRRLYEYWNELRGQRAAPERDAIDPAAIAGVLSDTFVLEVDDALAFPFRLSGARTNALFERQLKGRSFVELWSPQDQVAVRAMLFTVLDGACPIVAGALAAAAHPPAVDLELLLLPLRHGGKTHARLLGCLSPARHPAWFGLMPAERLDLVSMRVVQAARDIPPPRRAARMDDAPGRRRFTVHEGGRQH